MSQSSSVLDQRPSQAPRAKSEHSIRDPLIVGTLIAFTAASATLYVSGPKVVAHVDDPQVADPVCCTTDQLVPRTIDLTGRVAVRFDADQPNIEVVIRTPDSKIFPQGQAILTKIVTAGPFTIYSYTCRVTLGSTKVVKDGQNEKKRVANPDDDGVYFADIVSADAVGAEKLNTFVSSPDGLQTNKRGMGDSYPSTNVKTVTTRSLNHSHTVPETLPAPASKRTSMGCARY